ncbi:MAG: hypothetical protein AAGA80_23595 [Cyanobacteria bacterium P01_F01_bin.143]
MNLMTLEEIQKAIYQLSADEQLTLLDNLVQAMKAQQEKPVDRHSLVNQLRGCLKKSDQPTSTDVDIELMKEERLVEKYLK